METDLLHVIFDGKSYIQVEDRPDESFGDEPVPSSGGLAPPRPSDFHCFLNVRNFRGLDFFNFETSVFHFKRSTICTFKILKFNTLNFRFFESPFFVFALITTLESVFAKVRFPFLGIRF